MMTSMTIAATALDTRVGTATPATPACSTYTPMAFPATFIQFIRREVFIETLEFPMIL